MSGATVLISGKRRQAITAGLLLGMSLGALEATVVGTAMPTIVATMGGLAHYSWVFSAYLLTSTASVPIWGRLSDLYGRRRLYLMAVVVFLVGSVACGAATTMLQLIIARAMQGLGAGGIIPLTMTIIGELYTLTERPRTQALFSGVWGTASVLGPLVGGYITDALSWRWVFYINIPFGLLCLGVIATAFPPSRGSSPVKVDWLGAALLFSCVSALLVALAAETGVGAWFAGALALLVALIVVERRQTEPILPLDLLKHPLISRTLAVVFLVGVALFGAIAFVPLYVQGVMGGTATQAGQVLTPLFLGWVTMSVVGAKITVRVGYRLVAISGSVLMTIGFIGLTLLDAHSGRTLLFGSCLILGAGMGCQMLSLLLAVQHGVERSQLGIATSLNQFARSIGAAIGVAAMGAIMSRGLAGIPLPTSGNGLSTSGVMALSPDLQAHFASALHLVFVAGAAVSVAALVTSFFLPSVHFGPTASMAGEELIEAEMASLDRNNEPVVVE